MTDTLWAPDFRAIELHDQIVRQIDTDLTVEDVHGAINAVCGMTYDNTGRELDPWRDDHWHDIVEPALRHLGFDYDEVIEVVV
jgi:hypothetical protein